MKKSIVLLITMSAGILFHPLAHCDDQVKQLQQQLQRLKKEYEQRIQQLEARLQEIETQQKNTQQSLDQVNQKVAQTAVTATTPATTKASDYNPGISLILDGRYSHYQQQSDQYQIPGYLLSEEAGLDADGVSLGESEITLASNIDDKFYGQATIAFSGDAQSTEVAVEEAYFQTTALGHGLRIKGGRFLSTMGYLNQQHAHVWDFADAPLIYRGLFGNQLKTEGVQVDYLLPTDYYINIGAALSSGAPYPGAGSHTGIGAWNMFAILGDDIDYEQSWQLGLYHWQQNHIDQRESLILDNDYAFRGENRINSLSLVYKWAPNGNPVEKNLKLQFEFFDAREKGDMQSQAQGTDINSHRQGWYAQAVYQFMPQWKTAFRYGRLYASHSLSNPLVFAGTNFLSSHHPQRYALMLEWLPSEYSRIRLQYNRDQSTLQNDNQFFVQYTFSLGSHGAHQY